MRDYDRAKALARIAHHGQTDKAGEDYFLGHLSRVASSDIFSGGTIAYLHDILEDTVVTEADLLDFGFRSWVIEAVVVLTRQPEMSYASYISRLQGYPGVAGAFARSIKRQDLRDHLRDTSCLTSTLIQRYSIALEKLI